MMYRIKRIPMIAQHLQWNYSAWKKLRDSGRPNGDKMKALWYILMMRFFSVGDCEIVCIFIGMNWRY